MAEIPLLKKYMVCGVKLEGFAIAGRWHLDEIWAKTPEESETMALGQVGLNHVVAAVIEITRWPAKIVA